MFEKEKAFSCYLYDCKEALIISLYDKDSKCPQVDNIRESLGYSIKGRENGLRIK